MANSPCTSRAAPRSLPIPVDNLPVASLLPRAPKAPLPKQADPAFREPTEELWRRFKAAPSPELLDQLATVYMPYLRAQAAAVAARLPRSVSLDEVEAAGHIGLLHAIRRFDPSKGIKFETFCAKRLRGAMYDYLRELDPSSRLVRVRESQAEAARDSFRKSFGYDPTPAETRAQALEQSRPQAESDAAKPAEPGPNSQSEPPSHIPPPRTVRLADADPDSPLQRLAGRSTVLDAAQRADLKDYLTRRLSPRERLIVILLYFEGMTMKETGLTIGISESRISQVHQGILGKLRAQLHERESELHTRD